MKIYNWDDIKLHGDCIEYMQRELRMVPIGRTTGNEVCFNCPWRANSDSGAFKVQKNQWYDHVDKEGGSIIDLVARARFDGDIFQAQEHLGEYLGLQPKQIAKKGRKLVKVYDYRDLEGNIVHQTCRWDPKDFNQRRPNPDDPEQWIWSLDGITPILYNLKAITASSWVIIVEGEKDADNLIALNFPATTCAMGAEKWHPTYNTVLAGKNIVLIPDNDDPGRAHAALVASNLKSVAKQIKVINLPDLPPKGDVSNWILAGGTREALMEIIKGTSPIDQASIAAPENKEAKYSVAKKANEKPFSNFTTEEIGTAGGDTREIKTPIQINDLVDEVHRRFWDFPRRVGSTLFDHDRRTGAIRHITTDEGLFAWIQEKSKHLKRWGKSEGCVTKEELFNSIYHNSQYYDMISGVPNWPKRTDVYYTHGDLPAPTPDGQYFNKFSSFFSPATIEDSIIMLAYFATPLYYRPRVGRPIFIIDAKTGQGTGKTKLAECLATLYGGDDPISSSPFVVSQKEIEAPDPFARKIRELLTSTGRLKRIAMIDNVVGYFSGANLCSLATMGEISGMAQYGKSSESRPNDLTFIVTVNSATLSRDMIDRSMFINLERPEVRMPNWEREVTEFIKAHRLQIIADIIGILEAGPKFEVHPFTRFESWEREVLAPICGTADAFETVMKQTCHQRDMSDGEKADAQTIEEFLAEKIADLGINPETDPLWIRSEVLTSWVKEVKKDVCEKTAQHIVRNMAKGNMFDRLSAPFDIYPHHGKERRRGLFWNRQISEIPKYIIRRGPNQGVVYDAA